MLIIIGTYRTGGKTRSKIDGVKVYDTVDRKMYMFPTENVLDVVKRKKCDVVGVKTVTPYGEEGNIVKLSTSSEFNVRSLDIVDEYGIPVNNNRIRIPIEVEGFGSSSKIHLLDSSGNIEKVTYDEFVSLLNDKKIVGAHRCSKGTINYSSHLRRRGICIEQSVPEMTS